MNTSEITRLLQENHKAFIAYMTALGNADFMQRYGQKWTAGQQLQHITICVKPLVQVFSMDKPMIAATFGVGAGISRNETEMFNLYKEKLDAGGKAPERFVPPNVELSQKQTLTETLQKHIDHLCAALNTFNDDELDTLLIPHPLMGNITLREMLINAIQHVEHHHKATQQNLA